MIQECITDYWYELQRGFFPANSNTSKVISKVKGREALHTVQFRNLTALQLEADPALLTEVINATTTFQMPSNHIPNVVKKALNTFPGSHGIVGEAMLEQLGLTTHEQEVPMNLLEKIQFNLRKSLKRYVYGKLDVEGFLKKSESPLGPSGLS